MNNYTLEGFLGEGAYGIVLKAVSKRTHEPVAIKKFKDKDTDNPLIKKVIVRELRALRTLKHPNIVQLKEAFRQSERLFLVFEYCEQSLLDLQTKSPGGRLPLAAVRGLGREVLQAVEFMHDNGLLHRDVKPENILVTRQGHAKLCDFGFARTAKPGEELTDYVATRWYRSPELLLTPVYAAPADLWAVGCVLGEAVSGQPLFPGENLLDQLHCIHSALGGFPRALTGALGPRGRPEGLDLSALERQPAGFNPQHLRDAYLPFCHCPALVDLIARLLVLDPRQRLTARQALEHPFFAEEPREAQRSAALGKENAAPASAQLPAARKAFLPHIKVPQPARKPFNATVVAKSRAAARKF